MGDGGVNATLRPLYPSEGSCTHCIGGYAVSSFGLGAYGQARHQRNSCWSITLHLFDSVRTTILCSEPANQPLRKALICNQWSSPDSWSRFRPVRELNCYSKTDFTGSIFGRQSCWHRSAAARL